MHWKSINLNAISFALLFALLNAGVNDATHIGIRGIFNLQFNLDIAELRTKKKSNFPYSNQIFSYIYIYNEIPLSTNVHKCTSVNTTMVTEYTRQSNKSTIVNDHRFPLKKSLSKQSSPFQDQKTYLSFEFRKSSKKKKPRFHSRPLERFSNFSTSGGNSP